MMKTLKITVIMTVVIMTSGCSSKLGLMDPDYDGYFNVLNTFFYTKNY